MAEKTSAARAWYAVVLLGALYIVAFIDRMILGLLVEPLKADLHVSDTQISLLIGFNFAIFYSIVGVPLGWMSDRANRRNLILISTLLWTACTFFSGLSTAFWLLCALRLGVAVGEAALSPSAMSLIGDLFPRESRAGPTTLYMCFGAFGATAAYLFGGIVVRMLEHFPLVLPGHGVLSPWRVVLFAVASPALVLTALLYFTMREPQRVQAVHEPAEPTLFLAWTAPRWRPLVYLFIAGATAQAITIGLSAWAPTYLVRRFGWDVGDAGIFLGLSTMIGGLTGMAFSPSLTERWTRSGRADALPLVLLGGACVGMAGALGAVLAPNAGLFVFFYALSAFGVMGTGLLLMVAIQLVALPRMRGELMAVCLVLNSLLAMGCGPFIVTLFAKWLGHGALQPGFAAVALICGPIAIALILAGRAGYVVLLREADGVAQTRPVEPVQNTSVPPPSITSVTPLT
ncbi:MAG: MFS transporter [Rhizomicrobium sp.]